MSLRDCSERFRMGADSGSARLDEWWTGGVLVAFEGLARKSGRDEMSWMVCGCSAWSKGLNWSTTGEDGLEWPRRWKRRWPNMSSAKSLCRLSECLLNQTIKDLSR